MDCPAGSVLGSIEVFIWKCILLNYIVRCNQGCASVYQHRSERRSAEKTCEGDFQSIEHGRNL